MQYQSDPFTPNTFRGVTRLSIAPRSLHVGQYPGPNTGNLLDIGFSGWAMVRSNLPVSVYQVIKTLDPATGEVASELRLMGNSQPVVRADFSVGLLIGSPARNVGISLVNPSGSRALKLTLRLIDHRKEIIREKKVELKAMWQESFVGTDLFVVSDFAGVVRITSDTSDPFAFVALGFAFYTPLARRRDLLSLSIPQSFDPVRLDRRFVVETLGTKWDFPVPLAAQAGLRDLGILVTSFGFFLVSADGGKLGPFSLSRASAITTSPDLGIAVVGGPSGRTSLIFGDVEKAVIFADKRKVVKELMHGEVVHILELPGSKLVEVKSEGLVDVGLTGSASSYLLIDREKGEVVDRFSGLSSQLPPWKQ